MAWPILDRGKPNISGSKKCNLCTMEKYIYISYIFFHVDLFSEVKNILDELRFSMVHSFLATNAIELQRSVELSLKELPSNILFHPSESIPEGPDPPVVLIIALLIYQL